MSHDGRREVRLYDRSLALAVGVIVLLPAAGVAAVWVVVLAGLLARRLTN